MGPVTTVTPEPSDQAAIASGSTSGGGPKACPSCGARFPADALFCSLDGSPLTSSPGIIAAAAATDPYLGREILGHIEIRQLVGIGAMGRVYRAFQRGIDRDVAVKVLHRELSSNKALVARFDREAKVASRLAHPNVVHVLLVGQLPDGAMYIVMEYLDGLSLQSALAGALGAMPLPRALHIALQLCDAAGEGHAQAIVHRDLKPENVMLVRRADDPDFVKVLDFGIARVHWGDQSMATAAGLIFGTARYISPEGAQGEQVGPPGDVYSIATMLYQMLCGRTPFHAEQAVAVLVQQIHDPPPPLKGIERAAYVPDPIAAVIMKNLSKQPGDRAPDARAFGRALLEAAITSGLSAQDVLARPSLLGATRGSPPSAVQMPSMQRTRQLTLDPDTASRIGAVTAFETPAPSLADPGEGGEGGRAPVRTEISDPSALPPGTSTTKWIAPPRFGTQLLPPEAPASPSVDETMDDAPRVSTRTVAIPDAPSALRRPSELDTAPPQRRAARMPVPVSKPPSGVETTMAGDEAPAPAPSQREPRPTPTLWRGALLGTVCFLVGALGMVVFAWKAGLVGSDQRTSTERPRETSVPQARLEAPPEFTVPEPAAALPPLDLSVSPRSRVAGPTASTAARPSSAAGAAGAAVPARQVAVESSSPKPGVGQPVDFAARFPASARPAKVDGALFLIAGPGVAAGTALPASDDGAGVFRTTFTFLQEGRFDVTFTARADGSPAHGTRAIVVGDPGTTTLAPPEAPVSPPVNATSNGGTNSKWL
jgi:eukaryotic-like serine/threonine-protein kinase